MKKQYFSGRSQSGAFLLQIAFALVIMGIITKAYYEYQIAGNEKQLKQIIAGEMLDLDKALTNYANTFSGQLIANTAISGVSNIYAPTISELAALNVGLPSTFAANPMLNGGYKTAVSILPPNNDIQVVVYTANPVTNSKNNPDDQWASVIAVMIGNKGAFSTAATPASLTMVGGSTTISNPAGSVAAITGLRDVLSSSELTSQYWKDPVANYASLPSCTSASIWHTRIVQTPTSGTGPRAYTCDGTNWKPIAEDDNGKLSAGIFVPKSTHAVNDACADTGAISKDSHGGALNCLDGRYVKAGRASSSTTSESLKWEDFFSANTTINSYADTSYVQPGTGITKYTITGIAAGCSNNYIRPDVDVFQTTNMTAGNIPVVTNVKLAQIQCPYTVNALYVSGSRATDFTAGGAADTTSTVAKTFYHGQTTDRQKHVVIKFKRQLYDKFITVTATTQFMRGTELDSASVGVVYGELTNIFDTNYTKSCANNSASTYTTFNQVGMRTNASCIVKIPKVTTFSATPAYDYAIRVIFTTAASSNGAYLRLDDPEDPLVVYTTTYSDDN